MKEFNEFFETNLKEKNFSEEEELKHYKRITKFFISILLFFIMLFLILGNAKAETITNINLVYAESNLIDTSLMEELRLYADSVNSLGRDYILTYDKNYIKMQIYIGRKSGTNQTACNLEYFENFISSWEQYDYSVYMFGYRNNIIGYSSQGQCGSYIITANTDDMISNRLNTRDDFKTTISLRMTQNNLSANNNNLTTTGYVANEPSNTRPTDIYPYTYQWYDYYSDKTQSWTTIYYATKPVYYINSYYNNEFLTSPKTKEYLCNYITNNGPINSTNKFVLLQNDNIANCGDNIIPYKEIQLSANWEYIDEYTNLKKRINSYDIYFTENETNKIKFTLQQDNTYITKNDIRTYYKYGKKCTNNTCYWEEIPYNINGDNINFLDTCQTNDTETGFTCIYDYTIDMGDYEIVKLGIGFSTNLNNNLNNYNLSLETKNNTTLYTDLNYISGDFNREEFIIQDNYKSILVQNKTPNNDILYYSWSKAYYNWKVNEDYTLTGMDYVFPYNYTYNLNNNSISTDIIDYITTTNYDGSNLQLGEIHLNTNQALYIGMFFIQREYQTRYWVYFNDEVYYTISNTLDFNVDYNEQNTTINTIGIPDNIREEYSNAYMVNLSEMENIILSYYDKKEDWLNIWYSIYDPMPQVIKHILSIGYTMLLGYGIFLIFKD